MARNKPLPAPRAVEVTAPGAPSFRSELLGELFDRRPNTLGAALKPIITVGLEWLEQPDARDFEEWRERGIIDSAARRRPHVPKLP